MIKPVKICHQNQTGCFPRKAVCRLQEWSRQAAVALMSVIQALIIAFQERTLGRLVLIGYLSDKHLVSKCVLEISICL